MATCRWCKDEFNPYLKKKGFAYECDACADEDVKPRKKAEILYEDGDFKGLAFRSPDWEPVNTDPFRPLGFIPKVITDPQEQPLKTYHTIGKIGRKRR